ncbi:phenol-soluble modulin export ABC transporter permease subunit PmtB [Staphylococcus pseudoxylosus]|uniref:phenol-soluble modulin export ABC transporter permease subunit PmtB n=1 Tax=Staphylococcus pseudoxylosus TaxID=2282419 RepID=UPI00390652A3
MKLRKWTIIIYSMLLLFSPLQLMIGNDTLLTKSIYSAVAMILLFISIVDSGHAFRFNSKLGHKMSYDFFASLPVSKKALLNANYVTVLMFTLVGAAILSLYNIPDSNVSADQLNLNVMVPYSYITINFFAIPIAFKRYTEQKSEYISYLIYLLTMFIIIPIFVILVAVGLIAVFNFNLRQLDYLEPMFNYGFLVMSILFFITNYFIQYKKIN